MADTEQEDKEECPGCNHLWDIHFRNIKGIVRCTHIETGTSSRGVIGIPYSIRCDCRNGVSVIATERRAKSETDITRFQKEFRKICAMKPDEEETEL